jgi:hypothetical protein
VRFIVGINGDSPVAEQVDVVHQGPDIEPRISGEIHSIDPDYSGGHIRTNDGRTFYFPRTELKSPRHMSWLAAGMPVQFCPAETSSGPKAFSVEQKYTSLLDDALVTRQRISARVRMRDKKATFGFVYTEGGAVLLRSEDFSDPTSWPGVKVGDEVTFIVELGLNNKFIGREIKVECAS